MIFTNRATETGALPAIPGPAAEVWVRDLPRALKPQPGVIELWLPPREAAQQSAS